MRALPWILLFAVGALIGYVVRPNEPPLVSGTLPAAPIKRTVESVRVQRIEGSDYTRPMIGCETLATSARLDGVGHVLKAAVDRLKESGAVLHASVFVRDLEDGDWTEVDGQRAYSPASMNKMIWLVSLLVHEEREPGYIQREVMYPGRLDPNAVQRVKPQVDLKRGAAHPLWKLAEAMIVESDNDAMRVVQDSMPLRDVRPIFADLGFASMTGNAYERYVNFDRVTTRMMAHLLEVLYDASYLSLENSERALAMLNRVRFAGGTRKAAPPELKVAHKFGEYWSDGPFGPMFQFHDCGIVYFPRRPHVICVMTRGPKYESLTESVDELAQVAFDAVQASIAQREARGDEPRAGLDVREAPE